MEPFVPRMAQIKASFCKLHFFHYEIWIRVRRGVQGATPASSCGSQPF